MRVAGINWVAALVAAVAIYAIGALIYGVIIDPQVWMEGARVTEVELEAVGPARMPFGAVMPLATAFGMAILFKWAGVNGLADGVKWGVLIAFLSAIPALWYGWVYGIGPASATLLDSVHLLLGHIVAGAILASWK